MSPVEAAILIGVAAGLGALAAAGRRPQPRPVPVREDERRKPGAEKG